MIRYFRILAALLRKEWRLFQAHTAVQLVVGLVAVFGAAVGLSGERTATQNLQIVFPGGGDSAFEHYVNDWELDVQFYSSDRGYRPRRGEAVVELPPDVRKLRRGDEITIRYLSQDQLIGIAAQQIIKKRLLEYLHINPPVPISVVNERGEKGVLEVPAPPERKPTDARSTREITMILLCTMAVLMVSFNMFSIVLSEEKAGKLLLAQLISPASMTQLLVAKFIFYLLLSGALLACIVGAYRPSVLGVPVFWLIAALASSAYMSVAAIIVSFARKQSTAGVLTLGYVLIAGIVVLLAHDLPLFARLQDGLPETYLFTFFMNLLGRRELGEAAAKMPSYITVCLIITAAAFIITRIRGIRAA